MQEITLADYVRAVKVCLGDPHMSDRALGQALPGKDGKGYSTSAISDARYGYMSDHLALDIGKVLEQHKAIEICGEVLVVARATREQNAEVKAALLSYVGKLLTLVPAKVTPVERGVAVPGFALRQRRSASLQESWRKRSVMPPPRPVPHSAAQARPVRAFSWPARGHA
jgi:hypothetical protein